MTIIIVLILLFAAFLLGFIAYDDLQYHIKDAKRYGSAMVDYTQVSGEENVAPYKAHEEDAGADLVSTSVEEKVIEGRKAFVYNLGIAVEIPEGYVGLIFPRSSICKTGAVLANSVGVIDSNYRGELKAVFYAETQPYAVGERCCQLIIMPYPTVTYKKVDKLSDSNRGTGGFGSTGK
jgi:dUTP pyrophosphatase